MLQDATANPQVQLLSGIVLLLINSLAGSVSGLDLSGALSAVNLSDVQGTVKGLLDLGANGGELGGLVGILTGLLGGLLGSLLGPLGGVVGGLGGTVGGVVGGSPVGGLLGLLLGLISGLGGR